MIVIKIGGTCTNDQNIMGYLADELGRLHRNGQRVLLVHGGGTIISELQKKYNLRPQFIDGIRQTSDAEMPLVDMALSGFVNKKLVRIFQSRGIDALGLCGADCACLVGQSIKLDTAQDTRTGHITKTSTKVLRLLWDNQYFPILAPPGLDENGQPLNFNADEAAFAMAKALKSTHLLFISEVDGILKDGKVIDSMNIHHVKILIEDGTIHGGMVPKIQAAVKALQSGVGTVVIAAFNMSGDLTKILNGETGTHITL